MNDIDKLRRIAEWSGWQTESWWDGADIPTILKVYEAVVTDGVDAIEDSPTARAIFWRSTIKRLTTECANCGDSDDGFRSTLKGSELEWIENTLEDEEGICESCARDMAQDAEIDNRIYQESRADHEDGVWDGEHFYPDNTIANNR